MRLRPPRPEVPHLLNLILPAFDRKTKRKCDNCACSTDVFGLPSFLEQTQSGTKFFIEPAVQLVPHTCILKIHELHCRKDI